MNRSAVLLVVLLVVALGLLLYLRCRPPGTPAFDASETAERPEAALARAEFLVHQARLGATAASEARTILERVAERGSGTDSSLRARMLLVDLELLQGNHQAAADTLLHAIQEHPDSAEAPRMLCELALLLQDRLDRSREAREVLRRVVHLYPDSPHAAVARGFSEPVAPDSGSKEGDER